MAEEGGETGRQHVDADAGDELVALERDGGDALQAAVASETLSPASRPSQALPVMAATAAAPKAANSILPSRPISKTPARSE
jgi:hypothetical protein